MECGDKKIECLQIYQNKAAMRLEYPAEVSMLCIRSVRCIQEREDRIKWFPVTNEFCMFES